MVKTHEINLSIELFNSFADRNYIILDNSELNIQKSDYILFRQTISAKGEEVPTDLFRMTQVQDIVEDSGLKEGYVLINVNKL